VDPVERAGGGMGEADPVEGEAAVLPHGPVAARALRIRWRRPERQIWERRLPERRIWWRARRICERQIWWRSLAPRFTAAETGSPVGLQTGSPAGFGLFCFFIPLTKAGICKASTSVNRLTEVGKATASVVTD